MEERDRKGPIAYARTLRNRQDLWIARERLPGLRSAEEALGMVLADSGANAGFAGPRLSRPAVRRGIEPVLMRVHWRRPRTFDERISEGARSP